MIKEQLNSSLKAALGSIERYLPTKALLKRSRNKKRGDYFSALCLELDSNSQTAVEIAATLKTILPGELSELCQLDIAPPGFLNFKLKKKAFQEIIRKSLFRSDSLLFDPADSSRQASGEAASTSSIEEPVFPLYYAHARCSAILRQAIESRIDIQELRVLEPLLSKTSWVNWLENAVNSDAFLLQLLDEKLPEYAFLRALILDLDELDELIRVDAVDNQLRKYALNLAYSVNEYLDASRQLSIDEDELCARLSLILATRNTLAASMKRIDLTPSGYL